jgi:hypothetical protein
MSSETNHSESNYRRNDSFATNTDDLMDDDSYDYNRSDSLESDIDSSGYQSDDEEADSWCILSSRELDPVQQSTGTMVTEDAESVVLGIPQGR